MVTPRLLVLLLMSVLGAAESFQAIPADYPASCWSLTEDGRQLVIGHAESNQVSVWNAVTRAPIATITCKSPRWILCRGDRTFVAQAENGLISVIDSKSWKVMDELDTHFRNIYYLSAPQGRFFTGTIIATSGTYTEHVVLAIDTKTEKSKQLVKEIYMSVATVAYNGDSYVLQGDFTHSPSGTVAYDRTAELLAGRAPSQRGEHHDTGFLQQFQECSVWAGGAGLYVGMPPRPLDETANRHDAPFRRAAIDRNAKRAYLINEADVVAYGLAVTLPKLATVAVSIADEDRKKVDTREPMMTAAEAVTLDGKTHLFARSRRSGILLAATLVFPEGSAATAPVATPGAATKTEVGATTFPDHVAAGAKVEHRLVVEGTKGAFTVMSGPTGLTVSAAGVVTWTPTAAQVGQQQAKIRAEIDGATSFHRISTEVVSAAAMAAAGGDSAKLAELVRHPIVFEPSDLSVAVDGRVLLAQGRTLESLDDNGITTSTVELPEPYAFVRERGKYLVACKSGNVELLDRETGKLIKRIAIPGRRVHAMALHPRETISYISCDMADGQRSIEQQRIIIVDETAGTVIKPARLYGRMLAVHPSGQMLFTGVKDFISDDVTLTDIYGGMHVLNRSTSVDLLVAYDLAPRAPKLRQMNQAPGVNGRSLVTSPDGRLISYVSGGGYREGQGPAKYGYVIPGFTTDDIRVAAVSFETGAYPTAVAYHPILPLVAVTSGEFSQSDGKKVWIRSSKDGEAVEGKIALPEGIREVFGLRFTRAGTHLLVDHRDAGNARVLVAFPLTLADDERAAMRAGAGKVTTPQAGGAPKPEPALLEKITVAELDALGSTGSTELKPVDLANRYESAVVLIESAAGNATGFIVGRTGLVLTCAHGIPPDGGAFSVRYRVRQGQAYMSLKDERPVVVAIDPNLDLALLRIKPTQPCTSVRLPVSGAVVMGERVYVIGNPGGGGAILESTMTDGLISNPKRRVDDQDYLQISAAINPGSSGSPLFNAKGEIIGLVVLKAMDAEAAGFAVPRDVLVRFLRAAAGIVPKP